MNAWIRKGEVEYISRWVTHRSNPQYARSRPQNMATFSLYRDSNIIITTNRTAFLLFLYSRNSSFFRRLVHQYWYTTRLIPRKQLRHAPNLYCKRLECSLSSVGLTSALTARHFLKGMKLQSQIRASTSQSFRSKQLLFNDSLCMK